MPSTTRSEGSRRHRADDAELDRLHRRCWEHQDPDARRRLVEHYDRFARTLAMAAFRHREPSDDLIQVAREALLHAVDRFDPTRGIPFPAFARPTIEGTLKRHFRDVGWAMRIPRRAQELSTSVARARERLGQSLGREPTVRELATEVDVRLEDLELAMAAEHDRRVASLDAPTGPDGEGEGLPVASPEVGFERLEQGDELWRAFEHLDRSQQWLVHEYWFAERTQRDIAGELGVSQMQVSRLLASAVVRLRSRMDVAG